jgi:hypothetical protein
LQVTEDLCKQGLLLDNYLPAQQAQHLLRLICHTADTPGRDHQQPGRVMDQPGRVITRLIRDLDEWSLRASMIDIKLMYLLEKKGGESVNSWLEEVATAIVEAFKLGENSGGGSASSGSTEKQEESGKDAAAAATATGVVGASSDEGEEEGDEMDTEEAGGGGEPAKKRRKLDHPASARQGEEGGELLRQQRRFGPIWMIPHLVKGLKFLQTKILQVAGRLLETANWSRCAKSRVAAGHQPFLQLVLTCLRHRYIIQYLPSLDQIRIKVLE